MGVNVLGLAKKAISALEAAIRAIKALRGQPDGFVGTDSDGFATTTHLGSGVPSATKYLRGDGVWAIGTALADDDYGDIVVTSTGGTMTVQSFAGKTVIVEPGDDLQPIVDAMNGGGTLLLKQGTHYADSGTPSTPLTIVNAESGLRIEGMGEDQTVIKSPILIETGKVGIERVCLRPDGTSYALKIFKSGSFLSRCHMREVFVGASFEGAGDGPVIGIQLDGAGVFLAEKVTVAFCESHGLLADSTAAEPNTTLKFDMCSFVGNGGYGARILGSCSIAEFNNGNFEQNTSGELYAESVTELRCHSVDFETSKAMGNQVECQNCSPVKFDSCHFLNAEDVGNPGNNYADRAILLSGSGGHIVEGCRFDEFFDVGVVRMGETTTNCAVRNCSIQNDNGYGWIEDYSRP